MVHPIASDLIASVLHRDSNIIVLNKPPGLASHGGPKTYFHVDAYLPDMTFGIASLPTLAHRLDRDTAGCLLLCRHAKSAKRITRLFTEKKIGKSYWAVVRGNLADDHGFIDAPIAKHNDETGWRMVVGDEGLPSKTEYRVLGRGRDQDGDLCWLELVPHTGRTHQLRVHLDHIGHPVLGDPFYGRGDAGPVFGARPSLMLLSRRISVPFHADRDAVIIDAPPPVLMRDALLACGYDGGEFAAEMPSLEVQYGGDGSNAESREQSFDSDD